MKKILMSLLVCNAIFPVFGEQIFQAKTGQTITVTISEKELTRIQVSGFSIDKGFTAASVKTKKYNGQLYILPSNIKSSFNLFITDTNGDSFNLLLTPSKNKAGDSIVIIPDKASIIRGNSAKNINKTSTPYERSIINLVQVMYLGMTENDGIGYQVVENNVDVPIWKKMKVTLLRTYSDQTLNGYIFDVTNNGSDPVLLDESEFYKSGVLGVAIDSPSLSVGQSTKVFVVQENPQGIN